MSPIFYAMFFYAMGVKGPDKPLGVEKPVVEPERGDSPSILRNGSEARSVDRGSSMKVYAETRKGRDGLEYGIRYLLEPGEYDGLRKARLIGECCEVVGMQEVADQTVGGLEAEMHRLSGGTLQ
jgi:hypothetical protein